MNSETKSFGQFAGMTLEQINAVMAPLSGRIQQIKVSAEVADAIQNWGEATQALRQAIDQDFRPDELRNELSTFLNAADNMLRAAQRSTKLDTTETEAALARVVAKYQVDLAGFSAADNKLAAEQISPVSPLDDLTGVEAIQSEISALKSRLSELEVSTQSTVTDLQTKVHPLRDQYETAIRDYQRVKPALDKRAEELDKLLGLAGKKVFTGSFDTIANNERSAANILRIGALIVMLIAIMPIVVSLWEASKNALTLDQSLLRLTFSLLLSVPAAYMARESAKHRQQQYIMRQTALDVGAIDSYISTLPQEVQNRIKEGIASKLFAPKSFDQVGKESYPINVQELIMKLVDLAATTKESKDSKKIVD